MKKFLVIVFNLVIFQNFPGLIKGKNFDMPRNYCRFPQLHYYKCIYFVLYYSYIIYSYSIHMYSIICCYISNVRYLYYLAKNSSSSQQLAEYLLSNLETNMPVANNSPIFINVNLQIFQIVDLVCFFLFYLYNM